MKCQGRPEARADAECAVRTCDGRLLQPDTQGIALKDMNARWALQWRTDQCCVASYRYAGAIPVSGGYGFGGQQLNRVLPLPVGAVIGIDHRARQTLPADNGRIAVNVNGLAEQGAELPLLQFDFDALVLFLRGHCQQRRQPQHHGDSMCNLQKSSVGHSLPCYVVLATVETGPRAL